MLKSTMSLSEARKALQIESLTESSATKNGREFLFIDITSMKTGEVINALVSDKALSAYKAGEFADLCLSEIWDDNTDTFSGLYSIHNRPANKQVKKCAW